MKTIDLDLFVTPIELASLLKISVQALYKQLKDHNISTRNGNGRHKIYPDEMRRFLEIKNLQIPKSIMVMHIVKGGVGKTTLVHALASRASAYGFRTLMIDLDQQANLTTSFGIYTQPKKDPTILDVIMGNRSTIQDIIVPITDFLHIVPSNLNIANLDLQLIHGNENLKEIFSQIFQPVLDSYDLIFIDCPPSLSRVTTAAHCFATQILMPVNTDRFSIDGLELTLDHLLSLQKKFNLETKISIVINKFDARQKILGNAVIDALTSKYRDFLLESYISVSKQIDNNIAAHKSIWASTPSKAAALEDLNNLFTELFELNLWGERSSIGAGLSMQEELVNV